MTYDFTAASEFLAGIEATPQQIKEEIRMVLNEMAPDRRFLTIRQTRTYCLLSMFADFIERITPKDAKQAI